MADEHDASAKRTRTTTRPIAHTLDEASIMAPRFRGIIRTRSTAEAALDEHGGDAAFSPPAPMAGLAPAGDADEAALKRRRRHGGGSGGAERDAAPSAVRAVSETGPLLTTHDSQKRVATMTAEEALRLAGAEGLTLQRAETRTGFRGIKIFNKDKGESGGFRIGNDGRHFETAAAAALVRARES